MHRYKELEFLLHSKALDRSVGSEKRPFDIFSNWLLTVHGYHICWCVVSFLSRRRKSLSQNTWIFYRLSDLNDCWQFFKLDFMLCSRVFNRPIGPSKSFLNTTFQIKLSELIIFKAWPIESPLTRLAFFREDLLVDYLRTNHRHSMTIASRLELSFFGIISTLISELDTFILSSCLRNANC